jgi:hypothetical protein
MKKAGKGKRKNNKRHKKLRAYKAEPKRYLAYFKNYIKHYLPKQHFFKIINDGISAKQRKIVIPDAEEVVLHNAIIIVLIPILSRGMYEHSYACIEGKGIHKAKHFIEKWIKNDYKHTKYVVKMDIKQFFNSIKQMVLLKRFSKILRDSQFLFLIKIILQTVECGIALGYTTSHWFANWLLTPLDHYIKEILKIKYYVRFVDDIVLFGSNKRKLHKERYMITQFLINYYGLETKGDWQLFLLSDVKSTTIITEKTKEGRFLDFLGFRFYRNRTTIRRKLLLRIKRKALHIYKKHFANIRDARQMVTYAGFCKYGKCFEWFQENVLKYVSIKKLRKQISNYDKQHRLINTTIQQIVVV